jgi:TPR repeat protein
MQEFIATNPDGGSASRKAEEFLKAGKPDLALLIYRYADRKNDPEAATAIGRMYDPQTHTPQTSPFPAPDSDQAVSYYRKAAEGGDPAAQFALGKLMMSGATSGPNDAEQGVVWLQRAAKQGNADAINELQKLGISN